MTEANINPEFEALLDYVRRSRSFDFTGYKRPSLMRRFNKRMQTIGIEGYSNYQDYLEVHPEEFGHLFNTLLINVTAFFRDRHAWEYVISDVVPRILAHKEPNEPIRIWSAGCASGEEAYTLAIIFAEAIGVEAFRERVKIYATDVDEEALNQARQAIYSERALIGLTPQQIAQFFEKNENYYTFRKDLRRSVIFGRHDLIQDAPISRIDLLVCRNILMYFNAETQKRILARFNFALRNNGFLFLGKAEMLSSQTNIFMPLHLKCRIFTKVAKLNLRDRLLIAPTLRTENAVSHLSNHFRLREVAFDAGSTACVVVDVNGLLTMVNERARMLFNLTPRDLNRPLQDLELSYRPVELRSCIEQAYTNRRPVNLYDVAWQIPPGDLIYLDIQICPLVDQGNHILGVSLNLIDVTRYKRLQEEVEKSSQELEMAYEELQFTNEELETTNEELQFTNEELETTNEELQSTNEELETMNEELQSTNEELQTVNEELQTVNEELQRRTEELNQTNAFLHSILASLRGGVVVVDRNLQVQTWNYRAEDLWGLRSEEVLDHNFLNLDVGLPVEQLRQPIRCCLSSPREVSEVTLAAINRRGKSIQCRVICTPLIDDQEQVQGVILVMDEQSDSEG